MRARWIVVAGLLGGVGTARADDLHDRITRIVSHGPAPTATAYLGSVELACMPHIADPRRADTRDPRGTAGVIWQASEVYLEVSVGGVRVHPTDARSVSITTGYVAWF